MNNDSIEILERTGYNQYGKTLYPKTITKNVITRSNISLDDELFNLANTIKDSSVVSVSEYIVIADNVIEIIINNPNFIFLNSKLEVFYNGLLVLENVHYEIVAPNKIRLIGYSADISDEFVFKVYNSLQCNVDTSYLSLPSTEQEACSELLNSITNYVSDINKFKNEIIFQLNNAGSILNMSDSYDKIISELKGKVINKDIINNDLGPIVGTPYSKYDLSYSLGHLFGTQNDVSYFDNNLGNLF